MSVNRDQVMTRLSYLLGEETVPTSGINARQGFIQDALDEIYRSHEWEWAKTTATTALTSNVATLASGIGLDLLVDIREVVSGANDDKVYTRISYEESDNFEQGTYKYWLDTSMDNPVVNTKEADATLTYRYSQMAPQINASVTTPFPSANVVALGALKYLRQAENPFADVSQEEQIFRARLEEYIANENRNKPRRTRSRQSTQSHYTGAV